MTILDELADAARDRVYKAREIRPYEEVVQAALSLPKKDFAFEKALSGKDLAFICECKKASPSRGLIAPDFDCVQIAEEYEAAGADAVSVLTEPTRFLGSDLFLQETAEALSIPVLRKDFIVDPYMIYEARLLGADAILLIVSLLKQEELEENLQICQSLGLSALVECHDEQETDRALQAGARIIGVNNRNLRDFSVDMNTAAHLRERIPEHVLFVSESGVKGPADIQTARDMKASAVLIGETLMRAENKAAMLRLLKGEI